MAYPLRRWAKRNKTPNAQTVLRLTMRRPCAENCGAQLLSFLVVFEGFHEWHKFITTKTQTSHTALSTSSVPSLTAFIVLTTAHPPSSYSPCLRFPSPRPTSSHCTLPSAVRVLSILTASPSSEHRKHSIPPSVLPLIPISGNVRSPFRFSANKQIS